MSKFVQLKTGGYAQVLEDKDGQMTVIDLKGNQSTITPEDVGAKVEKWYQILKLIIQFATIVINAIKKK